jgi:hypothetical protein
MAVPAPMAAATSLGCPGRFSGTCFPNSAMALAGKEDCGIGVLPQRKQLNQLAMLTLMLT